MTKLKLAQTSQWVLKHTVGDILNRRWEDRVS